jgi:hypothetical protein
LERERKRKRERETERERESVRCVGWWANGIVPVDDVTLSRPEIREFRITKSFAYLRKEITVEHNAIRSLYPQDSHIEKEKKGKRKRDMNKHRKKKKSEIETDMSCSLRDKETLQFWSDGRSE